MRISLAKTVVSAYDSGLWAPAAKPARIRRSSPIDIEIIYQDENATHSIIFFSVENRIKNTSKPRQQLGSLPKIRCYQYVTIW